MAKNTNRAASAIAYVAALVLATGAWAAHWEMYSNNPVTYAKEIFGGDDPASTGLTLKVDDATTLDDPPGQNPTPFVIENDEGTSIDLGLYLPNDGSVSVGDGSELEVTFSLVGARFGQAVNWTDIVAVGENFAKVGGSQKDGRRGDASVTLKVTYGNVNGTAAAILNDDLAEGVMKTATDTGYFIRFDLGSIIAYAGAGSVTAKAEFRVTDGPDNNFPTGELVVRKAVEAVVAAPLAVPAVLGVDAVTGTSNMVATSVQAVKFTGTDGVQGNIDLADRAKLDGATQVAVGSISHTPNPKAVEADGKTFFWEGKGMDADIHISVEGSVRDTDTVYFDLPDDKGKSNAKMDDKEALSITDGIATGSFRLTNGTVYFVPDGETPMSAGDLEATFTVEYDASSVVDPAAVKGSADLEYSGVDQKARAYAIPNQAHPDEGNVRIKCEETGDSKCTVFLDCNEQDGNPLFGELAEVIDAGATRHLTSEDIAGLLEDGVDDWMGRLSCDILSAHRVSVQVLVRSEGSLVNNTYVDGGAPTPK